jgi:hypothetical protein
VQVGIPAHLPAMQTISGVLQYWNKVKETRHLDEDTQLHSFTVQL